MNTRTNKGNHSRQISSKPRAQISPRNARASRSRSVARPMPQRRHRRPRHKVQSASHDLISLINRVKAQHNISLLSTPSLDTLKFMRGHIRNFLGTQQPIIRCRTSFTTLTTSGTNLTQVVAMDVTGITAWSSLANLFDEYRVRSATLHIQPLYQSYGASATAIAAMPIIVVVDYDDATALASLANAIQYDTQKIIYFGTSNSKNMKAKRAQPEGIPDLSWVTTATPTVPFWWKFWSLTTLIPSTAAIGYCFIEAEVEFRQLA